MTEPFNFQQSPAAGKTTPEAHGFIDEPQEELGLSESVGFAVNPEGATPPTPEPQTSAPSTTAAEPGPPATETAPPAVPSGSDLGLSESVGFIQPASEKLPATVGPAPKPTTPARPHPTNRLEQAWANMPPVEIKPPEEPKAEPARRTRFSGRLTAAANPPKETKTSEPTQDEQPLPVPPIAPVASPVEKPMTPIAPLVVPVTPSSSNPLTASRQAQIDFLEQQIWQLRVWAYGSTALSVLLLILLWVTRPPGALPPPADPPAVETTQQ